MSIYATLGEIGIRRFGDQQMIEILIQSVPAHIDHTGPEWDFLLPPVGESEAHRAVLFVERGTQKGSARNGQEYLKPLLMLTGGEYETIGFAELLKRLEDELDKKYGERPAAVFFGPDGGRKNLYPPGK
jgi:hypothetical protein